MLKGLHLTNFSEILNRKRTPNKFFTHQLKIMFKHSNFVRKPFLVYSKKQPPLVYKIWVQEIFFIFLHHKYPSNLHM